ncbi:uncharacterized protein uimc1 isoform X2 [Stigmatopora nigra]
MTSWRKLKQTWRPESEGKLQLVLQPTRMAPRKQRTKNRPRTSPSLDVQENQAITHGTEQDEPSTRLLLPGLSEREKRWREREYKAKRKEMTDEKIMALALHQSTQEANNMAHRMQQDEVADRVSIENNHPHKSSDLPTCDHKAKVTVPSLSQDVLKTCETVGFVVCSQLLPERLPSSASYVNPSFSESDTGEDFALGEDFSQCIKSPVFGDTARLNGSPNAKTNNPDGANSDWIFYSQESSSSPQRPSPCLTLSPVFPRSLSPPQNSSRNWTLSKEHSVQVQAVQSMSEDEQNIAGVASDSSETEMASDATPGWTDKDSDDTVRLPSPIFPGEKSLQKCQDEPNVSSCSLNEQECVPSEPVVHYYWGVPFCPRGLDPDAYTQVIVTQFDVYAKCLKEAQKSLLKKAPWGDPILPLSEKSSEVPQRSGLRRKKRKLGSQEMDGFPGEMENKMMEEQEDEEEEEEEQNGNPPKTGDQTDTDDSLICPETQFNEDVHTQIFTPKSPECPQTSKRTHESDVKKLWDEEHKMDVSTNGENQANHLEEEGAFEECGPPEQETATVCPICQGSFSIQEIEEHAAFCYNEAEPEDDGGLADEACSKVSSKPRKKRRRKAKEEGNASFSGKILEKCYVCQKAVARRDYGAHTELCIQRRTTKELGKGNLLEALEHLESMHAGKPIMTTHMFFYFI